MTLTSLRDRYLARLIGNAWSATVSRATVRSVAGGLLVLATIVAIITVFSGQPDKVAEAAQNLVLTAVAVLILGAVYMALNLVLAPWRLDRALRAELEADRRTTSTRVELLETERDEARRALDRHIAATAVTVDVRVVARGSVGHRRRERSRDRGLARGGEVELGRAATLAGTTS